MCLGTVKWYMNAYCMYTITSVCKPIIPALETITLENIQEGYTLPVRLFSGSELEKLVKRYKSFSSNVPDINSFDRNLGKLDYILCVSWIWKDSLKNWTFYIAFAEIYVIWRTVKIKMICWNEFSLRTFKWYIPISLMFATKICSST